MARGRFITAEGVEGSGKTTQIGRLAASLRRRDFVVSVTREPGGAPGAEAIRALMMDDANSTWSPLSEALLHYAARREHLDATVLPALDRGEWVLSDRFSDSTMAYQSYGQGLSRNTLERLHALVAGDIEPDLTLLFDLPSNEGIARARARSPNGDRYERMDAAFHRRVREGFLEIARRQPGRCVVIDAADAPDAIAETVWATVVDRFGIPT